MLNKGLLKEFLSDKETETFDRENKEIGNPPKSPAYDKIINVISSGSEICGLTYSASKRRVKEY